jgi:hypothetical protein
MGFAELHPHGASGGLSWGNAIALAALALSIISLGSQWQRFFTSVLVSVEREGSSSWFVFENIGRAVARDVNLTFDSFTDKQPKPVFVYEAARPLPVRFIRPGGVVRVPVFLVLGTGATFEVDLSRRDRRPWRKSVTTTV